MFFYVYFLCKQPLTYTMIKSRVNLKSFVVTMTHFTYRNGLGLSPMAYGNLTSTFRLSTLGGRTNTIDTS